MFDATALSEAGGAGIYDRIRDFDQGNTGGFTAAERDMLDLSTVVGAVFFAGHLGGRLVRAVADPFFSKTLVQVDTNGVVGGQQWTTLVLLDEIKAGSLLKVALTETTAQQVGVREGLGRMRDFNGDGRADILWRNDDGTVALWTLNGGAMLPQGVVGSAPNEWHLSATDDFNGDGKADVLWRHDYGAVALWQMNGTAISGNSMVSSTAPPEWQILDTPDFNGDGRQDILWRHDSGAPWRCGR